MKPSRGAAVRDHWNAVRNRSESCPQSIGMTVRFRRNPQSNRARRGALVDEVDAAEIPAGVAHLDARQMPVPVWHFEPATLDHYGAVALPLRAGVGSREGCAQRVAVRARPCDGWSGEEARNGGFPDLGVALAVVVLLDLGLRRLVEVGL